METQSKTLFFELYNTTTLYFNESINNLLDAIVINIEENSNFEIKYSFSYDKQNYSEWATTIPSFFLGEDNIYIAILFTCLDRNKQSEYLKPQTIYALPNFIDNKSKIIIKSIFYNNVEIKTDDVKFVSVEETINSYPLWNLYDNQNTNIKDWLSQINAMFSIYGHTVIYFKTEPLETKTSHTFANHLVRNVVAIKRIKISIPNNELPSDSLIYTDNDFPLLDEFIVHIGKEKFEIAFGFNDNEGKGGAIPISKDYLFFPMLNKMFTVVNAQPNKSRFMGKIGWWDVYLAKYEKDSSVVINQKLNDDLPIFPELPGEDFNDFGSLFDEMENFIDDTLIDEIDIDLHTIEEKKKATESFSNKLVDSTFRVSLKETEKIRALYDSRLKIVNINPENGQKPITMYNCSYITKRSIGMEYNMTDYTTKNKFSNYLNTTTSLNNGIYVIDFNFIFTSIYTGEIFDVLSNENVITSISSNRLYLEIIHTQTNSVFKLNFKLEVNKLYSFSLNFSLELKQYACKIYSLENIKKVLIFQNIYIYDNNSSQNSLIPITNLYLYGGSILIGDIAFFINSNQIIKDTCNPLLQMQNF